jgi:hypothetical protein
VSNLAPVILFIYNRPEHTRRTLISLAANPLAIESDLIIYADGPKSSQDVASVRRSREVAKSASGFRSVQLIERESNIGLANSIIAGVSEMCDTHGRVIVLEDDLVVAPQFLKFVNAGLERYKDSPQVYQISGYLFPGCEGVGRPRFLPLTTTWGWATWRRAWKHFDAEISSIGRLRSDAVFRRRFDLNGAYDYSGMVERQERGAIDSWGIRWYLSVFARDGLTLYPGLPLIENIGFDGSGTHGGGHSSLAGGISLDQRPYDSVSLPENFDVDVECIGAIEQLLRAMNQRGHRRLGMRRLRTWLKI